MPRQLEANNTNSEKKLVSFVKKLEITANFYDFDGEISDFLLPTYLYYSR